MARLRRRLLFAALTGGIALVVLVIAGEVLLRVYVFARGWTPNCYAATLQLFRNDPQLGSELSPNFKLRSGVFKITTNSLGFRGPEISPRKPPGVTRIAIVGGSSVFGYLVHDGEVAARLLEKRLRRDGYNVQVINGGVPGYNLYQTAARFRRRIAPLDPDIVILYLGFNDLPYIVSEEPEADRFRRHTPIPPWKQLLSHSTLYGFVFHRLLASPLQLAPPQHQSLHPTEEGAAQFGENLQRLAAAIDEQEAQMVVCSQAMAAHPDVEPALRRAVAADPSRASDMIELVQWLRDALREFAERHEAPLIDAYGEIPPTTKYLGDYVHLTVRGEQQLAELLAQRLRAMLPVKSSTTSGTTLP